MAMAKVRPAMKPVCADLAGRLRIAISGLAHGLRIASTDQELSPTRLSALSIMDTSGPIRLGDLAGRIGITPATASRLVERLHRQELITRSPDPDDLRVTRLALSDTGRAVLAKVRHRNTDFLTARLHHLSPQQRTVLDAALPVLEQLACNETQAAGNHCNPHTRAVRESRQEQHS